MERKTMWKKHGTGLILAAGFGCLMGTPLFSAPAEEQAANVRPDAETAKALLREAKEAVAAGDLDRAEMLAKRASLATGLRPGYFDDTPEKVLAAVARRRDTLNQEKANELLVQSRKALEDNKFDLAEKLVNRAEALRPKYGAWQRGDRPERIRAEIAKRRPSVPMKSGGLRDENRTIDQPAAASTQNEQVAARSVTRLEVMPTAIDDLGTPGPELPSANSEAKRGLLAAPASRAASTQTASASKPRIKKLPPPQPVEMTNNTEDQGPAMPVLAANEAPAEDVRTPKPVSRAKAAKTPKPLVETEANLSASAEIKLEQPEPASPMLRPRTKSIASEAKPAPVQQFSPDQARDMLAKARGYLSQQQYGESLRLAVEVKKMGLTFGKNEDSPDAVIETARAFQVQELAQKDPQAVEVGKKEAIGLLADARQLQRSDRLPEAMKKAQEAQKWSATFGPGEVRPETVIAEIQNEGRWKIEALAGQAQDCASKNQFVEAEKYLRHAEQMAVVFQMDTSGLQQRLAALQQEQQKAGAVPAQMDTVKVAAATQTTTNPAVASVPTPQPTVQQQSRRAGTQLQQRAEQAYSLAARAYQRQEYTLAASYLQGVDIRYLDQARQGSVQTILAAARTQPAQTIIQTSFEPSEQAPAEEPGKATVTDQQFQQLQPTPTLPATPTPAPVPDVMHEVQARRSVQFQKLKDSKYESEKKATRLASGSDYDSAIAVLAEAVATVKNSGFDEDQIAPLRRDLEARMNRYKKFSDDIAKEKAEKEEAKAKREAPLRSFRDKENRDRQIAELMKQYKELMRSGKYDEAEVVAMKARELDPKNPQVEIAAIQADTSGKLARTQKVNRISEKGFNTSVEDVSESGAIVVSDKKPVNFPDNFDKLTERRRTKSWGSRPFNPETQEDKETRYKLNSSRISVDFKNEPLQDVLEKLRTQTGVNLNYDKPSLDEDAVDLTQPINLRLDNVTPDTVLKNILQNARLAYVVREGIVMVTTQLGQRGRLVTKTYDVASLIQPVDDYSNIPRTATAGQTGPVFDGPADPNNPQMSVNYRNPSASTAIDNKFYKAKRQPGQTIETTLIDLITNTIEPSSWRDRGGAGSIEYYPLTLGLVVSQTPDIQEQIQQLLDRLRELQDLQVTVEVKFITLSENFFERIGIDLDFEIDDNNSAFDHMVATNSFAAPGFLNAPSHLNNVTVGLQRSGQLTQDLDIPISQSSFDRATPPFGGYSAATPGGLNLGVAFLSDIEVFLLLEATQGNTRSNIMQAPKLTLFNGQAANINVTTEKRFVTGFDFATDLLGTTLIPRNDRFQETTNLAVQAVISADRRYVRLNLSPTLSNIDPTVGTFPVQTPQGLQNVQQPVVNTINVATTVNVPDGGTVLMGGLKTLSEGRNEFGVPILNKIPYINRLFKNTAYGRETKTLLIMVTPRIIIPEEEEERIGTLEPVSQ